MGYRKFKLVNSLNQTYELTDHNFKQFLHTPQGLGYRKDLDGIRVGNRFKIVKREYSLPSPSGELIFYDEMNENKYDAYHNFVKFASFYPLKLYYYVPSNDRTEEEASSIYLECEVIQTNKSEVSYNGSILRVPVSFKGLTFWLSSQLSQLNVSASSIDDSTYYYPLNLPILEPRLHFGLDPMRNIVMNNDGSLNTPVAYTITGRCKDPYIRFFEKKDDEYIEYGASKFIGSFDSVYVNSNDNDQNIILSYGGSDISNPAEKQDLSIANVDDEENEFFLTFLKIKPGVTYATISFNNDFTGTVNINWRNEYISF